MTATADPHADAALARSHRRAAIIFCAVVALAAAAAISILSFDTPLARRTDPATENAYVGGDTVTIASHLPGYLADLPIEDNQPVRKGQLVARLEDADYRAEAESARAQLAAAGAKLESLRAQQGQLAAQIQQVETGISSARADVSRTAPELARQRVLVGTEAGVRRALEQAEADQKRIDAGVESARAMLQVRRIQLDVLAATIRGAQAALDARKADLDLALIHLGWTRILAPADGTLGARAVRRGDLLTAGAAIATLTPLDTVWVDANFTERQIPDVLAGQQARITLDAFPGETLQGRVVGLSPLTGGRMSALPVDNTTGNFTKVVQRVPVRIAIIWNGSALRGRVRPGMSAVATVLTKTAP